MTKKCIPQIGEIKYYMKTKVSVVKTWDCFHLVEVKEIKSKQCLVVDICTLSDCPNNAQLISLWILGGSK